MQIDQLIIEITRKCNLHCEHCLRGNVQRINIDTDVIKKFLLLNDIDYINHLTITGGEPFIHPKGINNLAEVFFKQKVRIGGFYIVTNGTISPIPAMQGLCKFFNLIDDPEYYRIDISYDSFHENEREEIHSSWNLITHGKKEGAEYKYLIAEGRGKDLNPYGRKVMENEWIWDEEDVDRMVEGTVYINAKGMICKECDYSYRTQSYKNIGHCLSKKLKKLDK